VQSSRVSNLWSARSTSMCPLDWTTEIYFGTLRFESFRLLIHVDLQSVESSKCKISLHVSSWLDEWDLLWPLGLQKFWKHCTVFSPSLKLEKWKILCPRVFFNGRSRWNSRLRVFGGSLINTACFLPEYDIAEWGDRLTRVPCLAWQKRIVYMWVRAVTST
jgi:hypothetical protein